MNVLNQFLNWNLLQIRAEILLGYKGLSQVFETFTIIFKLKSGHGDGKVNVALQKKISLSSEAAIILEGGVAFQEKPLAIFVKLKVQKHI